MSEPQLQGIIMALDHSHMGTMQLARPSPTQNAQPILGSRSSSATHKQPRASNLPPPPATDRHSSPQALWQSRYARYLGSTPPLVAGDGVDVESVRCSSARIGFTSSKLQPQPSNHCAHAATCRSPDVGHLHLQRPAHAPPLQQCMSKIRGQLGCRLRCKLNWGGGGGLSCGESSAWFDIWLCSFRGTSIPQYLQQ